MIRYIIFTNYFIVALYWWLTFICTNVSVIVLVPLLQEHHISDQFTLDHNISQACSTRLQQEIKNFKPSQKIFQSSFEMDSKATEHVKLLRANCAVNHGSVSSGLNSLQSPCISKTCSSSKSMGLIHNSVNDISKYEFKDNFDTLSQVISNSNIDTTSHHHSLLESENDLFEKIKLTLLSKFDKLQTSK